MKKIKVNIYKQRNVVLVVIFDTDNRILLTKKNQPDSEFLHGKWQLPGLGMQRDETYELTLERIEGEFCVQFETTTDEPIESLSYRNKSGYTILHIFAGTAKTQISRHSGRKTNKVSATLPESRFWPIQNDSEWISYEDIKPSDCTPLTLEIIKIAQEH